MDKLPYWKRAVTCYLLLGLVLGGCKNIFPTPPPTPAFTPIPEGELILFETIERAKGNGSFTEQSPLMMIIQNVGDAEKIKGWISNEAFLKVMQTEFKNQLVIAVFEGWKPVYDFEVEVEQVVLSDRKVEVFTRFIEPAPDMIERHQIISSPYYVVRLSKESLHGDKTFILKVNGQELQESMVTISSNP